MPIIEFNVTLPSESLVEDIDQQLVQKREEDVLSKQEFELNTNDACGLDDDFDDTLRKQVFMPLIQKLSLLRYLEEVKDEASEDIQ